jgi:hypothetical protein
MGLGQKMRPYPDGWLCVSSWVGIGWHASSGEKSIAILVVTFPNLIYSDVIKW